MRKKKDKVNIILIPEWLCHRMNWHSWFWSGRSRAIIAKKCRRCGMNGLKFWELQKQVKK